MTKTMLKGLSPLIYFAVYVVAVRSFGADRASFIAGTAVGVVLYAVSAP